MSYASSLRATEREQLILAHLPQVRLIANRMHRTCPPQVELHDLVSAGTVGLIQAVDRFRPERGCLLKTLAEHRIRGAILDYLRRVDPLPRSARRFVKERAKTFLRLESELGRTPESAELAEALGLPIERYRKLEWAVRAAHVVSLDAADRRVHA
jgi:RNA polymerase sigma factor for flagellar operon FliA